VVGTAGRRISVEPASRHSHGKSSAGSWQWARTAGTQRALLDAAREVFVEQGFSDASIADVVERAGSSVGSLYHHFGGKSELYVALWQEHQAAQEAAASKAVADAKRAGVTDPFELFSAGTRAFLEGSWQRRDLVMLFVSGDSPPGFEVMARRRGHEWIGQNNVLLKLSDTSFDRLYGIILTSLIGEGAREVIVAKNRRQANSVIDAVIEYVRRLMTGGPWNPSVMPVDDDGDEQRQGASGQGAAAPRRRAARRPASGRAVSKVAPQDS
jgi:AcrR family transcriptional regulator